MNRKLIMNPDEIARTITDLANAITVAHSSSPAFIGIQRRGADLAKRLASYIAKNESQVDCGLLDINLYRDDWTIRSESVPIIGKSEIPFSLAKRNIILVDDVLYTGRTIRSALEAILDYGRPASVELLVLIDRGNRELPICANYIGRSIHIPKSQHIDVCFREHDGEDGVYLITDS